MSDAPTSWITGGPVSFLFSSKVLGRHEVSYYRCNQTGFIQTETPYWLDEAYHSAITSLDVGLVKRNLEHAATTCKLIDTWNMSGDSFLDFGGGYGLFTRLMRDLGYPFSHFDENCKNLFAQGFELESLDSLTSRFDLITAWEVFEHLPQPVETIGVMLEHSDRVLFSTVLAPGQTPKSSEDWWYFTPQTGQHVSFYTLESLRFLAEKFGFHFYSDRVSQHLFSRQAFGHDPFRSSFANRFRRRWFSSQDRLRLRFHSKRPSLTHHDFEAALGRLDASQQVKGSQ